MRGVPACLGLWRAGKMGPCERWSGKISSRPLERKVDGFHVAPQSTVCDRPGRLALFTPLGLAYQLFLSDFSCLFFLLSLDVCLQEAATLFFLLIESVIQIPKTCSIL